MDKSKSDLLRHRVFTSIRVPQNLVFAHEYYKVFYSLIA